MGTKSDQQRKALHLYFELLAEALNDAGYDMRKTLKKDIEIPWTKELVKDFLWRPIQKAMTRKTSTEDLDKLEVPDIYDVLDRHTSSKLGIHIEFPRRPDGDL